jgi:hypothetical protein
MNGEVSSYTSSGKQWVRTFLICCRQALQSMLPPTWQPGSADYLSFDIVLVVNKLDALPRSVSHGYVENWVRLLQDAQCMGSQSREPF